MDSALVETHWENFSGSECILEFIFKSFAKNSYKELPGIILIGTA